MLPTQAESGIGQVDSTAVKTNLEVKSSGRGKYKKFSDDERYVIGKYAGIHRPTAAITKSQNLHPNLKESTVRTFRDKYHHILKTSSLTILSNKTITSIK